MADKAPNLAQPGSGNDAHDSTRQTARRRTVGVVVGAGLLALAAPLSVVAFSALTGVTGEGAVNRAVDDAADFLSMMAGRSPGERTAAELLKTKKAEAKAIVPKQRALSKVRRPEVPKEFVDALVPPQPDVPVIAELIPTVFAPTVGLPVDWNPPGLGPPFLPPIGGGGGVPPSTPPPLSPPPVPIPPVPEPSTWLTMLLGFGLLGGLCRARRLAAVPA